MAGSLKAGDVLVLSNGELVTVEWVQHEILESPIKVYNFEVEDFHTYFVGENCVLVHNECGGRLGKEETRAQNREIAEALDDQGFTITGGGGYPKNSDKYISEEYLKPISGNGRKGGNYVDITGEIELNGQKVKVRVNTVDTLADKVTLTSREENARKLINKKIYGEPTLICIPKGQGIGNLLDQLRVRGFDVR